LLKNGYGTVHIRYYHLPDLEVQEPRRCESLNELRLQLVGPKSELHTRQSTSYGLESTGESGVLEERASRDEHLFPA
jgi:hypothetical protein